MKLFIRLCLIGALLASGTILLTPERFALADGGELTIAVAPSVPGGTLIVPLSPLCELIWETHQTPVSIRASYIAGEELETPKTKALKAVARDFAVRKLPWVLIFSVALGVLIVDGIGTAQRQRLLGVFAALAAAAAIGGLGYATIATFDAAALRAEPQTQCGLQDARA